LIVYGVLAVAMFANTWVHPTTWSIGVNTGDPQQFMWFLSWPVFATSHGQNPLFTDYQFYPTGVNLMWNTSVFLPAILLSPITQFGGPILAYNVLVTASFALSAWTAFILIRRFVSSQLAAAVGAALYGFSPALTPHALAHPNVTAAFMPPVVLLLLDDIFRVQRRPPVRSGLLLGVAGAAQLLIGEEPLVVTGIVAITLIWLALVLRRDQVRPKLKRAVIGMASATVVFLALAALPLSFQMFGPQRVQGPIHPLNAYVSDALSFFVPTRLLLIAPGKAVALSTKFIGGVAEVNSYVGILLTILLFLITVRYWRSLVVRLAALTGLLIAILSMGVTIHYAGNDTTIPAFAVGLAFPLLQRFLPGRLMLYLTFLGWLALSQLPVVDNILPTRLMVFFYLMAGVLLAIFLDRVMVSKPRFKVIGLIVTAIALLPLLPNLPYVSSPEPVPAFFAGGAASQIPQGTVALVVPLSLDIDGRAMLWQASAGMRFRMPEGYAITPDVHPLAGSLLVKRVRSIGDGAMPSMTEDERQHMLGELANWQVHIVIVGPMTNDKWEVAFFSELLNRLPQSTEGVNVWWDVDAKALSSSP